MHHNIVSFNPPRKTHGKGDYRSGMKKGQFIYTTYSGTNPRSLCACALAKVHKVVHFLKILLITTCSACTST